MKTVEYILHLIANQPAIGIDAPKIIHAILYSLQPGDRTRADTWITINAVSTLGLLGNQGAGVFWYTAALSFEIGVSIPLTT
jgi:hypothetical protein